MKWRSAQESEDTKEMEGRKGDTKAKGTERRKADTKEDTKVDGKERKKGDTRVDIKDRGKAAKREAKEKGNTEKARHWQDLMEMTTEGTKDRMHGAITNIMDGRILGWA